MVTDLQYDSDMNTIQQLFANLTKEIADNKAQISFLQGEINRLKQFSPTDNGEKY